MRSTPALVAFLVMASLAPAAAQERIALPVEDVTLSGSVTERYRIGALDGPEWEVFGGIVRLDFDDDGGLYVLDVDGARVHAYSRDGVHRWSVGARGGGPGEFSAPLRLAVAPGGSVLVTDHGRRAIVRLSAEDGRLLGSIPYPSGLLVSTLVPVDAGLFVLPSANMIPEGPIPVVYLNAQGEGVTVAGANRSGVPRIERTERGLRRVLPPTFSPGILLAGSEGRVLLADGDTYSLRILHPGGGGATLARAIDPRPVTERDRQAARDAFRSRLERARNVSVAGFRSVRQSAEQIDARIEAMTFAHIMPAIRGLRAAPDGTFWVGRPGPVASGPGPIDILRGTRLVGTLPAMPFPDAVGSDGLAAWVETGDYGVPVIRVGTVSLDP